MGETEDISTTASASAGPVARFFEHMSEAFTNAINLKFEDAEFHVDGMKGEMAAVSEVDPALSSNFLAVTSGFVTGLKRLSSAKTPEDRRAGLGDLSAAKNGLRNVREHPDFKKNPGLMQMALGLEAQIRGAQIQLARDRADIEEVKRLEAQHVSAMDEMILSTSPEDPLHWFLQGCKSMQAATPRLAASIGAAGQMNLDLAQKYMRDACALFETMESNFRRAGADNLMAQSAIRIGSGFGLIAQALDSYINVLHAAIVGDVGKSNVEALSQAERNSLDGGSEMKAAAAAAPGFFPGSEGILSYAESLATWIRNLRALCERSLSPKAISRSASPRAVIYFLVVFVVLLLALPFSGLVQKVSFMEVGFLLIISAVISLISAFGFESTRLMPWFDVIGRFIPGGRSPEKSKPNSGETAK